MNYFNDVGTGTGISRNLLGGDEAISRSRKPEIVADAAYAILTSASREFTGRHCIDEEVLLATGVSDFEPYRTVPGSGALAPDLFVAEAAPTARGA